MDSRRVLKLAAAILACQAAGAIGSIFTAPAIGNWYAELQRPAFAPPNYVFAPVWITLFALMGISLYLVWSKSKNGIAGVPRVFWLQLALNTLWSVLFFGLRSPFYGLVCIVLLWAAIAITMLRFYRVSRAAGLLLAPYILWVSFAAVLNAYFWLLN